jgi:hypothetical protein
MNLDFNFNFNKYILKINKIYLFNNYIYNQKFLIEKI